MSKNRKNAPKLRFPGFTDAWEQRRLGEIAEFNPKSILPDEFEYVDLESVIGTKLLGHRTETKDSAPSRAQRLAQRGDVFYQTVRPYQKNNYLFDLPYDNYVFSTGYAQMRPRIDSYFLLSRVQEEVFVKTVLDRCTGTSYPAINSNDLAEIEIKIPNDSNEQVKIGSLFRSLDHLITLHQRKLNNVKNLKAGLLQKMFPKNGEDFPEIRFPGFTDAWEQRKLGELAQSFEYGLNASATEFDGINKYLRITDIDDETRVFKLDDLTSPDIDLSAVENYQLKVGDVLFARTGASVGKTYCYKDSDGLVYFAGFLIRARIKEQYDSEFVFQNTLTEEYKRFIAITSQRSGQPGVNAQEYADFIISVPKLDEQRKISSLFANLDHLITLHQRKLEHLQEQKKALLQQMFV